MIKQRIGLIFAGLVVLAGAVWVGYRLRTAGFSWKKFSGSFAAADWSWMTVALALILATYVGRALRWEIMLRPLLANGNGSGAAKSGSLLARIMSATCIGFTAVVLFGRPAEAVRPYLIARKEGVSFSSQLAAWVVERFLDLVMVVVVLGVALSQISSSSIQPTPRVRAIIEAAGYTAGLTGLICLGLIVALRVLRGRVQERLVQSLAFLPHPVVQRIERFMSAFDEGMQSARRPSSVWLLVIYTVVEWAVISAAFYCVCRAFPSTASLGVTDIVILLGFVCFGGAVQIPGVGGGVQLAAVLVLTEFYGIGLEAASGVALALWLVNWVVVVPVGIALAFHEGIKLRSLRHVETSAL